MDYWIERQIKKLRPYKFLAGGTAKEWRLWEEKARTEHPVGWFIFETVVDGAFDVWRYRVAKPINDLVWWFRYRCCRQHQNHLIDTKLPPGYHDADRQLLHASFAILTDFVHRQKNGGHVAWDADPEHAKVWAEMQSLDIWWRDERPLRDSGLPEHPHVDLPDLELFEEENQDRADVQEFYRVCKVRRTMDAQFQQEDEDMLIRLAKIRTRLWD
ncbi:hypothetical protein GCM10027093_09000 [Paraburkholderia jirisanensis]